MPLHYIRHRGGRFRDRMQFEGTHAGKQKALRVVLIAMCVLSTLLGLALCSVGVFILANKTKIMSMVNLVDTQSLPMLEKYKTDMVNLIEKYDIISRISLAFLMVGMVIIVVSAIGIYGSWRTSRMFLTVYSIILGVLLASILILLIVLVVSRDRIRAEMGDRLFLLQDKYLVSLVSMVQKPSTVKGLATLALNFMHVSLQCCGVRQVGDTRNSSSWLGSERRIMKLLDSGVLLGKEAEQNKGKTKTKPKTPPKRTRANSRRSAPDTDPQPLIMNDDVEDALGEVLNSGDGGDVPDWMKFDVPKKTSIKKDSVPDVLPGGFEVDEKVFDEVTKVVETVVEDVVETVTEVLDDALTLRTPVTCCQLDGIKKLLEKEFDVQMMYDSLQEMSCVLEARNFGVNKMTCHKALWAYLMKFVTPALAVASILIVTLSVAIACAILIIKLDGA